MKNPVKVEWQWHLSWSVLWFRKYRLGPGFSLKTPLSKPLFSERNGFEAPVFAVFGFCLFRLGGKKAA